MKSTKRVKPCSVGGHDRRTGRRTGTRHRWHESLDGKCVYCRKLKSEVIGERRVDDKEIQLKKMGFEI